MNSKTSCPIIGFAGYSGSGKTTLLEKLIPQLKQAGLQIGLIKHAHHRFEIDQPGKDSYRLRKAGACETLISSGKRWALIHEFEQELEEAPLDALIQRLDHRALDIILYEGFKSAGYPLIWVQREAHRGQLQTDTLPDGVIALAWQGGIPENLPAGIDILDIDQPEQISRYLLTWYSSQIQ